MALFTVKPSRGTIFFFGLLGVGLLARYGFNKREQTVVARDAPLAHSARRLLRCVIGRDSDQLLWPAPENDDVRPWALALNTRLRAVVTEHYGPSWPSQCVPMAQRVTARLSASNATARTYSLATESLRLLNSMTNSRNDAIAIAENGALGMSLASLARELIKTSTGSESGWNSPLPFESMDLHPLRVAQLPLGNALPRGADGAMFAAPEWVLYQDIADRRAHALLFRANTTPLDVVLGQGAPLRLPSTNSTATLLASDDSDALLPLETARPTPIALPPPVRSGAHQLQTWQSVKGGGHRWLAYTDDGHVHIWSAREGSTTWEERVPAQFRDIPVAAIALVGEQSPDQTTGLGTTQPPNAAQLAVGALIDRRGPVNGQADPSANIVLRAYVLRYIVHGLSLERWDISAPPEPTLITANNSGTTPPNTAPAPVARNAPDITESFQPFHRTVLSSETQSLHRPRIRTCTSGTRAHYAVIADETYAFYSVDQNDVHTTTLTASRVGALTGGRIEFSCDERRSLLLVDVVGRPGALIQYDGHDEAQIINSALPEISVERRIDAAALVTGGVLVFLRTPSSIRAFVTTDGHHWQGGALLAALEAPVPARPEHPEIPANPGYSVVINAVAAYRDRVAALAVARGHSVRALRFSSDDGGITWH